MRRVKDYRVGRSGELVRAVVAIVEQRRRPEHIHVVCASEAEVRIRGEKAEIGTSGRNKRRGHLGMTRGCEVPIIGRLVVCAVTSGSIDAILVRVVDCIT